MPADQAGKTGHGPWRDNPLPLRARRAGVPWGALPGLRAGLAGPAGLARLAQAGPGGPGRRAG